jgi:hypothetical protein
MMDGQILIMTHYPTSSYQYTARPVASGVASMKIYRQSFLGRVVLDLLTEQRRRAQWVINIGDGKKDYFIDVRPEMLSKSPDWKPPDTGHFFNDRIITPNYK